MTKNEEKEDWHYLSVKKLSKSLRRITSKDKGNFCWLNCPDSFITEIKLKDHEKLCTNKDFVDLKCPQKWIIY